ncbi:kinesin-like protein KIN-14D [Nymphaea colorata]|nr:kinesin-like protein KIN-14D [Nymphaea colorata]XP_031480156.1 kinesin-like protein KIN-14D [Nymphaea colorata]XP_031480165.1 kinesin-like protein KIN-14D [Nymphaea colorata]XP_049932552.1 kinesin-like protein KIN-14D [Nymphaea colorata]
MGAPTIRSRRVLSDANASQGLGDSMSSTSSTTQGLGNDVTVDGGVVEFRKEYVNALLNERMKGKTKFDFKGKCEMMTEYIKRLRACIKWYLEQEELHDMEREKYAETFGEMNQKIDELTQMVEELRKNNAELHETFLKEEADKLASVEAYQKEVQARITVEKSLASMSEELEKSHRQLTDANQQIAELHDINKRVQEYNSSLQQYNSRLCNDAASASATIARMQNEKAAVVETLSGIRAHLSSVQNQLATCKDSLQEATDARNLAKEEVGRLTIELQQVREDRDMQKAKVNILTAEVEKYKECTGKSTSELEGLMTKTNCLEESHEFQMERVRMLERQLKACRKEKQMLEISVLEMDKECESKKKTLRELEDTLAEKELRIFEGELVRRKLHNTILELKGNIRVFCRVRPLLPEDDCGVGSEMTAVGYPSSAELLGRGIELIINPGQKHLFSFDKVFNHETSQEDVFIEISQLVQSALDGYKVSIFAYGQTGSGKTYTMMGGTDNLEQQGLIPRSLEQVFQTSQSLSSQGWTFKMEASMLEIYNETIRDLLCPARSAGFETSRPENGVGKQYSIKHDGNGNTYVTDLTIVEVCSLDEVSSLLHRAAQGRSVGRTQMNEQSSRSHCVFTLRISGSNVNTEQQVRGVLNLIDLAGSERLSKSGSTGERLKETQAINKSLSCLGDVILAIANKESYVPFRNSKLTYLLQPCLGGDSKTLMFVNISPTPSSVNESLCSLRFAAKVNSCEIGVARRQTHIRPSDARLSYG